MLTREKWKNHNSTSRKVHSPGRSSHSIHSSKETTKEVEEKNRIEDKRCKGCNATLVSHESK
jgi:hypothetical protein